MGLHVFPCSVSGTSLPFSRTIVIKVHATNELWFGFLAVTVRNASIVFQEWPLVHLIYCIFRMKDITKFVTFATLWSNSLYFLIGKISLRFCFHIILTENTIVAGVMFGNYSSLLELEDSIKKLRKPRVILVKTCTCREKESYSRILVA